MIKRLVGLGLTLSALSGCSMFGGDSVDALDDLREQIESSVHNEQRAETMLSSVDHIDELLVESADLVAASAASLHELFVNYDSTRQEIRSHLSDTAERRGDLQRQLLQEHLKIKSQATAEEWESIQPVQLTAVASRIDALVASAIGTM